MIMEAPVRQNLALRRLSKFEPIHRVPIGPGYASALTHARTYCVKSFFERITTLYFHVQILAVTARQISLILILQPKIWERGSLLNR